MNDYLSEKEERDLVIKWFREYGIGIIIAVVLGLMIGFGWRYWRAYEHKQAERASMIYTQLQSQNQSEVTNGLAERLMKNYPDSPYASLAAMQSASEAVSQNHLSIAADRLQWVLKHTKMDSLKQIARVREARILLAQDKPKAALSLIEKIDDPAYQPLIDSVRGDIYFSMGQQQKAKQFYQKAQNEMQAAHLNDPLLEMKLSQ